MLSASKPSWQQITALVSLSASGTVTGFSFVPHSPADLMSPTSMPVRLMALERSVQPAASGDGALRSAIVNVANYYLRMAKDKTPAEMEAIIWQHDSVDGVDHGESCAAFASLTLELAAQVVGQQSWVTGGTSYPWPLEKWADVRVDPNPSSPNIISVLQDAEANGRWHPLGDGYQPQPGDWVLFDNHVEVVTKYADGSLSTIGGDSLPNFSVNAHEYPAPLSGEGVVGFVNNGELPAGSAAAAHGSDGTGTASTGSATSSQAPAGAAASSAAIPGTTSTVVRAGDATSSREHRTSAPAAAAAHVSRALPTVPGTPSGSSGVGVSDEAAVPGMPAPAQSGTPAMRHHASHPQGAFHRGAVPPTMRHQGPAPRSEHSGHSGQPAAKAVADAAVPGMAGVSVPATTAQATTAGAAAIPGVAQHQGTTSTPYKRNQPPPSTAPVGDTSAQQAFIDQIAPGAMATQQKYGVPAAVTIAQAIDESGWGQSLLATKANNLFGIKGAGPAGSDSQPTQEYENGQWVTINAAFRAYDNVAQSINDHAELLATSGYYTQAMADRSNPNEFANALTGVYATNPSYGSDLIQLMKQYDLYRYDAATGTGGATASAATHAGTASSTSAPAHAGTASATMHAGTAGGTSTPAHAGTASGTSTPAHTGTASGTSTPAHTGTASGTSTPAHTGTASGTSTPAHAGTGSGANPEPQASVPGLMPAATAAPTPTPSPTPTPITDRTPAQTPAPIHATPSPSQTWSPAVGGTAANDDALAGSGLSRGRASGTAQAAQAQAAQAQAAQAQASASRKAQPNMSPMPESSASQTAQQSTSQGGLPTASPTAEPSVRQTPEPLASPTYEAGWVAGSGLIAGVGVRQMRRRSKRGHPANAMDPVDQLVSTTISSTLTAFVDRPTAPERPEPAPPDPDRAPVRRYQQHLPPSVKNEFVATARGPLLHGELLYRDIASSIGLSWELLAACDWMQCQARPRYSPVHGEKLGARNHDGTVYWSRSEALEQCARDLVGLADAVYGIDLTTEHELSVADLARVFASFRWGGLLRRHRTSAMEFPYSVAGLTVQHTNMRWPNIGELNTPDKPGARFRKPFGAVPIVLSLHYPATV